MQVARSTVAGHHGRVGQQRMLPQHLLDLARLDAKTADLHLVIGAADELQAAVAPPADHVARLVHPRRPSPGERIGHEALGGQLRPIQIAPGEARAADV